MEQLPSIRDYLQSLQGTEAGTFPSNEVEQAQAAFDACVDQIKTFRDKHIQIVTRYILIQARRAAETGQERVTGPGYHGMGPNADQVIRVTAATPLNIAEVVKKDAMVKSDGLRDRDGSSSPPLESSSDRGTGGTDILPFLKQSRDETRDSMIKKP
jgi:indoleamine 2,3-dioxygenase